MKRGSIVILVIMLMVSVLGAKSLLAKENFALPGAPTPIKSGEVPPKLPVQGITVNTIPFTEVRNINQMPEPVQDLVKNHRKQRGYDFWRSEEGVYYLAIFAGEKPTGGYGIEVVRIEDNEGMTNVTIQEKSPGKGAMVTMAITYPYTVVKFTGTTDQFQLFTNGGQKLLKNGDLVEIIECPTGNVEVQSALDERIKTMQLIAQAWANRLQELDQLLTGDILTDESRQILVKERAFVEEEWQKAQEDVQNVLVQLERGK